jgi:hypothetical protein
MKNFKIKNISLAILLLGASYTIQSCTEDLKQEPITEVTSASLYKDFTKYKGLLAKLYGGLAVGGQSGGMALVILQILMVDFLTICVYFYIKRDYYR